MSYSHMPSRPYVTRWCTSGRIRKIHCSKEFLDVEFTFTHFSNFSNLRVFFLRPFHHVQQFVRYILLPLVSFTFQREKNIHSTLVDRNYQSEQSEIQRQGEKHNIPRLHDRLRSGQ